MASASTSPKSKTTKTSDEDAEKATLLAQEYEQISSGSSPGQAISNVMEDESIIEPIDSGSDKISPIISEADTEGGDPGPQSRFQLVLDELLQTVTDLRFSPMTRPKFHGRTGQRRALSEGNPRAARKNDRRKREFGGYQYLGSDEPRNLDFISQKNSDEDPPLVSHRTWKQLYIEYSIYVVNSYFMLPFLILLFGLGYFTCSMGFEYFNQCQLLNDSPICFVFMGISAMAGLFSRIIYISTKRRWFARFAMCRCGTLAFILMFVMSYVAEFMYYIFRKGNPSAEKGPEYCHPFFYNYMLGYNWAVLGIIIILAVLHWPNSCHYVG